MRIIINESQFKQIILEEKNKQLIQESIFRVKSFSDLKREVAKLLMKGVLWGSLIGMIYNNFNLTDQQKQELEDIKNNVGVVGGVKNDSVKTDNTEQTKQEWVPVADDVLGTVYNATVNQCNADVGHTASGFRLDLDDVLSHRIIAMERTFMAELGLKYGDVVKIEGTGKWDGIWQVQDTMNKRFAGKHKIDILLPRNIRLGKWDNVKLYALSDKSQTDKYKENMAPQLSKKAFKIQQQNIKNGKIKV